METARQLQAEARALMLVPIWAEHVATGQLDKAEDVLAQVFALASIANGEDESR